MDAIDWGGIIGATTALLIAIGAGCKWLISFIVTQANGRNEMLKAENAEQKDRIRILEVRLESRDRDDR